MDAPISNDVFLTRFAGIARLYGIDALEKLARARVCVVGLGGVGSWTCEAIARAGVCKITLVDMDTICATNTNRQLHAMEGNYGREKTEVMAERLRAINPFAKIDLKKMFVTPESAPDFFSRGAPFDLVVDAIDGVINKAALIAACVRADLPIVSSGGCAGKRDGLRVEIGDLSQAEGDNLLKFVRRTLRSQYGFPRGNTRFGVPAVFSRELSRTFPDEGFSQNRVPEMISPAGGKPRAGTATFITGAFGFALAQLAIEQILAEK